jgi:hypothetical protein
MVSPNHSQKWALSSSLVSSTFLWIGIHSFAPLSAQNAQPLYLEIRPLFENGEHLGQVYHFRNVGLIQCPNGDLLAFVEARHGVSDHKEKDVLMRRSKDRGITWGPYEPIWGDLEEDHAGWKDPAPVVDETTGRLFYFMNTNESEKRLFYMTSDDSDHTWSDPIRIPDRLLRDNWKRWRNCPGPGIQLKRGQQQDSKSGANILWQEDFALPDGATHDTGTSAWHIAAPDGRFPGSGVNKHKFRLLASDDVAISNRHSSTIKISNPTARGLTPKASIDFEKHCFEGNVGRDRGSRCLNQQCAARRDPLQRYHERSFRGQ